MNIFDFNNLMNLFIIFIGFFIVFPYVFLFIIFGLITLISNKTLINFTFISSKKLKKVLNLLPKEYDIDRVPVFIFPNQIIYKIYIFIFPNSITKYNNLSNNSGGFHRYVLEKNGEIRKNSECIVLFNQWYIISLLHSLIHEFRHVYQLKIGYTEKSSYTNLIHFSNNNKSYNQQFKEIDANRYASYILKNNKNLLKKEFNLNFEKFNINSKIGKMLINKYKDNSFLYFYIKYIKPKIEKNK